MRHVSTALASAFVIVGLATLPGCRGEPPQGPDEPRAGPTGPVLLVSPAPGGRFRQNDASLGCDPHAARGSGFRVAFDWRDVEGAVSYKVVFQNRGAQFPAVEQTITASEYAQTMCNAFVIDRYLDGWSWRVAALGAAGRDSVLWSEEREYGFEPCRLADGRYCYAPPQ